MPKEYDVMQVCENGHKITGCYGISPEDRQKFCKDFGEKTIIACPSCNEQIQGDRVGDPFAIEGFRGGDLQSLVCAVVSLHCRNCGKPYPWTTKKIQTAIQIFVEFGDLEEKEKETIEQDLENIAKDVPEAELSARRIKRIWERGKSIGYEAVMEFASRTAAKILKEP